MRIPRPRSVRAKLTLTTVGVIAAVLLLLSAVTDFTARETLLASIDRDLRARGDEMARGPGPGGRGPGDREDFPGGFPKGDGDDPPRRPPPFRRRDPAFTPPYEVRFDGGERRQGPGPDQPYDRAAIEQAKKGQNGFSFVTLAAGTTRVYTTPRLEDGKVVGAVQTAYPMEDVYRASQNLRQILLTVVVPLGITLAALASLFVVGRLLGPLRRLLADAEKIDSAGGAGRLAVVGQDEFAELAGTLNGMIERIDASFQAQRAALEAQRRFSADASHELKTPLAVVKANAGLLLYTGSRSEEDRESLVAIDEAAGRMNRLVRDLLLLARADDSGLRTPSEVCNLDEIAVRAIRETPQGASRAVLQRENPSPVRCDSADLTRALVNLIDNAIKHSGASEPVIVRVAGAIIEVIDRGEGISPEHLPHLFERFYRVDQSRSSETGGTGLGLAIVRSIVEAQGGTVEVHSKKGEGTTFVVRLAPSPDY